MIVRVHSNYNNAAFTVTGSYPAVWLLFAAWMWDTAASTIGKINGNARRVAFLGTDASKQLFPGRNPVGQNVYLNDFPYVVIGVMANKKQDSSYDGWDVNKDFYSLLGYAARFSRTSLRRPPILSISFW